MQEDVVHGGSETVLPDRNSPSCSIPLGRERFPSSMPSQGHSGCGMRLLPSPLPRSRFSSGSSVSPWFSDPKGFRRVGSSGIPDPSFPSQPEASRERERDAGIETNHPQKRKRETERKRSNVDGIHLLFLRRDRIHEDDGKTSHHPSPPGWRDGERRKGC